MNSLIISKINALQSFNPYQKNKLNKNNNNFTSDEWQTKTEIAFDPIFHLFYAQALYPFI